jgi:hypothetical protein
VLFQCNWDSTNYYNFSFLLVVGLETSRDLYKLSSRVIIYQTLCNLGLCRLHERVNLSCPDLIYIHMYVILHKTWCNLETFERLDWSRRPISATSKNLLPIFFSMKLNIRAWKFREKPIVESDQLRVSVSMYINRTNCLLMSLWGSNWDINFSIWNRRQLVQDPQTCRQVCKNHEIHSWQVGINVFSKYQRSFTIL